MNSLSNEKNNLTTIEESFLVVLDSRNATERNNGDYNSSMTFIFEEPIVKPPDSILMSLSVLQFSCPNSIYNINETNNYLQISEVISGIIVNYDIYIPYGNYNVNSFMTQFLSAINTSTPNFVISFNPINNKLTLTNALYEFVIGPASTLFYVMGFVQGATQSSSGKVLRMPYTVNFNGIQSVNIRMANLSTPNIDSYVKSKSSIIQPIPIDATIPQISFLKTHNYQFKVSENIIILKILVWVGYKNNTDLYGFHNNK